MQVSVVLPVRNGAQELPDQLEALASQRYEGTWELLLVDNGSTDRTPDVAAAFADRLPIRLVDGASMRGAAGARNLGAAEARGKMLLFCDHDDVVAEGWLSALAAGLERHPVVGGALEFDLLNRAQYPALRRGTWTELPTLEGWLRYCPTANFAVHADAFSIVGGFDTSYTVAEDADICVRLQLAGFQLGFVPTAVVHYRERRSLRAMAKQRYRYGMERPLLYRRYRGSGFPRTSVAGGLIRLALLVPLAFRVLPSPAGRRWWVRTTAQRTGRLAGSLRYRVVYL